MFKRASLVVGKVVLGITVVLLTGCVVRDRYGDGRHYRHGRYFERSDYRYGGDRYYDGHRHRYREVRRYDPYRCD